MRALLAAWIVLLAHQGEELVIALPAIMLAAAFFLMRYAAGGKSEDKASDEAEAEAEVEAPPPPTFDRAEPGRR